MVKNATMELMQLKDPYYGWNGLYEITQHEAARGISIVGGQGMINATSKLNKTTRLINSVKQSECVILYAIEAMGTVQIMTNIYSKV